MDIRGGKVKILKILWKKDLKRKILFQTSLITNYTTQDDLSHKKFLS